MEGELKKIKKIYGENFAKLCRMHFTTILENEGALLEFLTNNIAPSRSFYDDLIKQDKVNQFKDFVLNSYNIQKESIDVEETPEELFDKAGYILIKCETDEDVKSFMKYYKENERLCTFNDPARICTNTIFFAVKKNVDTIRRSKTPRRQDEYGTSVISLQFSKIGNYLSIKNRYNHTVDNPDATFSNDLENIYPGLTDSFKKYYGLEYSNSQTKFELNGYVKAEDGKYYKYNCEINGVFLCENNILIQRGEVRTYDKMKFELVDNYLIDLEHKVIQEFNGQKREVEKIEIVKAENSCRKIYITNKDGTNIVMTVSKSNSIVGYEDNITVKAGEEFLKYSTNLVSLSLPLAEEIGDHFLSNLITLENIDLPNVKTIGNAFLWDNKSIKTLSMPSVQRIGNQFLERNVILESVYLPNLKTCGDGFLWGNNSIKNLSIPLLESAGNSFLVGNQILEKLYLPNLNIVGDSFLGNNEKIKVLSMPLLEEVGNYFLSKNEGLFKIDLPNLKIVAGGFLERNKSLKELNLPSLEKTGSKFLTYNDALSVINLPKVKVVGSGFLACNNTLKELNLPLLEEVYDNFFELNSVVEKLCLPRLKSVGDRFLMLNRSLKEITFPFLTEVGSDFMCSTIDLESLSIPHLRKVGTGFLGLSSDIKTSIKSVFIDNSRLANLKHIDLPRLKDLPPEIKKLITSKKYTLGV